MLLLSAGLAHAQGALTGAPRDATPLIVVPPAFPPGLSAPEAGIRVDIEGTVLADGAFKATAVKADGDHPAYVSAVADVLSWWRFEPAVDNATCTRVESTSRLAVWFEGSAQAPRISVTRPKTPAVREAPRFTSVSNPKVEYPTRLLGVEGYVTVLLWFKPDGSVESAQVHHASLVDAFEAATLKAARRTRVTWADPAPADNVCMKRQYVFCAEGGPPDWPHALCKDARR